MIRKLKIGIRLAAGFGLILALLLAIEWTALIQVRDIGFAAADLYNEPFKGSNLVLETKARLALMQLYEMEILQTRSAAAAEASLKKIEAAERDVASALVAMKKYFPGAASQVDSLADAEAVWRDLRRSEVELVLEGKQVQANAIYRERSLPAIAETGNRMEDLLASALGTAEALETRAVELADQSLLFLRIFAAVAVALTAALAWLLTRSIVKPLSAVIGSAQTVAGGNLGADFVADNSRDEVGIMSRTFAAMVASLRAQAIELRDGVNLLAAASSQISSTASELASSASETASSVSETTVTVEEVKQTAQVSMERAREVSGSAQRTLAVARSGEQTVEATASGMQNIREQMEHIAHSILSLSEQSRTIGEIISSVDDIAEQSNLLAVNAAIEAAKAGEQGKGFAVVAREVKNLAEGSRQATRQVRTILGDIQKATGNAVMATEQGNKAVDAGMARSVEVREALKSLAASIAEATQMAIQITAANQQQYAGVDQVTQAMANIREASRQNLDAARQLEDAARDIDSLSRRLKETTGKYRL